VSTRQFNTFRKRFKLKRFRKRTPNAFSIMRFSWFR